MEFHTKYVSRTFLGCSQRPKKQTTTKMTFARWMSQVEKLLYSVHGLFIGDLPDEAFRDHYDEKMTPCDMVELMYENSLKILEYV